MGLCLFVSLVGVRAARASVLLVRISKAVVSSAFAAVVGDGYSLAGDRFPSTAGGFGSQRSVIRPLEALCTP